MERETYSKGRGVMRMDSLADRPSGIREGKSFAGVFRNVRIFVHEPDKQQPWQLHAWFNVRARSTVVMWYSEGVNDRSNE